MFLKMYYLEQKNNLYPALGRDINVNEIVRICFIVSNPMKVKYINYIKDLCKEAIQKKIDFYIIGL